MDKTDTVIKKPVDISKLTREELDAELDKGYQDILAGRTISAHEVFEEMDKLRKEMKDRQSKK